MIPSELPGIRRMLAQMDCGRALIDKIKRRIKGYETTIERFGTGNGIVPQPLKSRLGIDEVFAMRGSARTRPSA